MKKRNKKFKPVSKAVYKKMPAKKLVKVSRRGYAYSTLIKKKGDLAEVTIKRKIFGKSAPEQYHFIVKGGKKLKDIEDLVNALHNMSDDVFKHHVNQYKNDFSTWLKDIFDEHQLSEEIRHIRNKTEMENKILRRLIEELKA